MKLKHTKNGNVKLTVTPEEAKVINWALTYMSTEDIGYVSPREHATAREVRNTLDAEELY